MSQFKKGDRVQHARPDESFGTGTVAEDENVQTGTVLVSWDGHRVTRESKRLAPDQSHVSATSLKRIP